MHPQGVSPTRSTDLATRPTSSPQYQNPPPPAASRTAYRVKVLQPLRSSRLPARLGNKSCDLAAFWNLNSAACNAGSSNLSFEKPQVHQHRHVDGESRTGAQVFHEPQRSGRHCLCEPKLPRSPFSQGPRYLAVVLLRWCPAIHSSCPCLLDLLVEISCDRDHVIQNHERELLDVYV